MCWNDIATTGSFVAVKHGRRPAQIAIAWPLKQPVVSTVIIGEKHVEQLHENLQAAEVELDSDDMCRLGAASRLPIEYPGWLLNRAAEHDM